MRSIILRWPGLPFVTPLVLLSGLAFAVPLGLLIAMGFATQQGEPTLANYTRFLGDEFSRQVLLDTLRLGAYVVLGTTLVGLPIALLYWHSGKWGRAAIVFLTLLPMLTSNVVRTFAWIVLLGRQGPISQTALYLELIDKPTSFLFTEIGLVVALCQIELPLLVLPVIAVMSRTDRSLVDAAVMLGAGRWRVLGTVLLPVTAPAVLAGWVLVFASATTSYVTQSVIGGARHIYVPQYIYREVGVLFQWPNAAAISTILLVATGAVMLAVTSLSRHRRLVGHA
jgi:putative spermidine/putrescine transport system permease protein